MTKIRRLTADEEKQATGLCYKQAYDFLLNYRDASAEEKEGAVLVHGSIVLTEGLYKGIEADHAWVEIDDKVVDPTFNMEVFMNKEKFYKSFAVNKRSVKKYTYLEALENVIRTQHYGTWD